LRDFDVVIKIYDPADYDAVEFDRQISSANKAFLVPKGLLALADHPGDPEVVMGVCMNQGTWALVFVQDLTKLDQHAKTLAERDFYRDWPEDYLQLLFQYRQDPRS
jgi:hypothetical protein